MPEKKVINVKLVKGKRRARGTAKPKEKSKTKQKQKQRQTVNVQVSSGGSGGGTSFIPMPQAPAFDYSLLASLIRPANTVDMPMRTMAPIPEPVQVRPAEAPTLVEAKKERVPISMRMSEREAGYESFPTSSGEEATRQEIRRQERAAIAKMGGAGNANIFPSESEETALQVAQSFKRKKNESAEEHQARYSKYLADKRVREQTKTQRANELLRMPMATAESGGRAPVFVGEEDVFGLGPFDFN